MPGRELPELRSRGRRRRLRGSFPTPAGQHLVNAHAIGSGPRLCRPAENFFGYFSHRCSRLERTGDSAIFADPPEVDGHEDDDDEGKE